MLPTGVQDREPASHMGCVVCSCFYPLSTDDVVAELRPQMYMFDSNHFWGSLCCCRQHQSMCRIVDHQHRWPQSVSHKIPTSSDSSGLYNGTCYESVSKGPYQSNRTRSDPALVHRVVFYPDRLRLWASDKPGVPDNRSLTVSRKDITKVSPGHKYTVRTQRSTGYRSGAERLPDHMFLDLVRIDYGKQQGYVMLGPCSQAQFGAISQWTQSG
eukprot:gene2094-3051_t